MSWRQIRSQKWHRPPLPCLHVPEHLAAQRPFPLRWSGSFYLQAQGHHAHVLATLVLHPVGSRKCHHSYRRKALSSSCNPDNPAACNTLSASAVLPFSAKHDKPADGIPASTQVHCASRKLHGLHLR